jgi:hypothetical protein
MRAGYELAADLRFVPGRFRLGRELLVAALAALVAIVDLPSDFPARQFALSDGHPATFANDCDTFHSVPMKMSMSILELLLG